MLGQCFATEKYNIIILAGGAGSRMGEASNYIPKALTEFGGQRAIDHIIYRYLPIAKKFIIGVCTQADLLISYVKGRYPSLDIEFSVEDELVNNARSTTYCLDHADCRYPTLITFCDLLMLDNPHVQGNMLYLATKNTVGVIGTFRHSWEDQIVVNTPAKPITEIQNGIIGVFTFANTPLLKVHAYEGIDYQQDLTTDIILMYNGTSPRSMSVIECGKLYEFGTQADLEKVRELWALV